jgi:hypothetical protein
MPNCASVFIDPYWEGVFIMDSLPVPNANATAFAVKLSLNKLPRTALQIMRLGDHAVTDTICNSVKVHFFHCENAEDTKDRLDFLYSTAFPLETLFNSTRGGYYGAFNYNTGDSYCRPLDGVTIRIVPTGSKVPNDFRTGTTLLCIDCPVDLHTHTMAVSAWMEHAVETLSPKNTCLFKRMHTFGRDRCSMVLFQDLHTMLSARPTTHGSHLPPALAIYAICNAAIVNRITLDAIATTPDAGTVLDVLRDTCACFTMCHHEGVYWPDKSCGMNVQDQPHPFSSVEHTTVRVFGRDDCEGRAAQSHCMVGLLKSMASVCKLRPENRGALLKLLKDQQASRAIPLQLSDATLEAALSACVFIGDKLLSKTYEMHTTLGDARFNPGSSNVTGHSFSIATDKGMNHRIVDSTGWQRLSLDPLKDITDSVEIMTDLYRFFPGTRVQRSITVDDKHENEMYSRIALGHDHIYFSFNAEKNELEFGTTLDSMRMNGLRTITSSADSSPSFRIKTRDFIRELCDENKGKCKWPNAKNVKGADDLLKRYEYIHASLPYVSRVTRPPPVTEHHILNIMNASWAKITDDTMKTLEKFPANQRCYRFSLANSSAEEVKQVEDTFSSTPYAKCCSYDFMQSRIFMVFKPAP